MIEIGDKYILEVTGKLECQNVDKNGKYIDNGTLWNTNVGRLFSAGVLNKLERCEGKQGTTLEEIRKTAYEKGLNDAWEAATKMVSEKEDGGFSRDELLDIFGTKSILCIFADNTAKEAISKIRAYEEKKKEKAKNAQDKKFIDANYFKDITEPNPQLDNMFMCTFDVTYGKYKDVLKQIVKDAPAANVKPDISGKRIDTGSGMKCSKCGEIQYGYGNCRNYCANCGARMEGNTEGRK